MKRTVGCRELGADCSFGATASNDAEVLAIMYTHIQHEHADVISQSSKDAVLKMIEDKIHNLLIREPAGPTA